MKGRKHGGMPSVSDQFVAELSHELGNVINGLLGMARLVRDSGLNTEQDRWLKAIEQSGQQLRRLVEAFRQGSLSQGPGAGSQSVAFDGVELLEQLMLAHAPAARGHADRLLLIVAPGVPRQWVCDPCLVRQLLDNLLGNALKFTRAGEVALEVSLGSNHATAPDALVLAVADSGPGIDSHLGRRMFRAYARGTDPARDPAVGRGLGLFICRRIVQVLGGHIEWSTPAAGGARFEVTLPGVAVMTAARPAALPGRLLRLVECRLDLHGSLQRSVACCLVRLGVACTDAASAMERVADDAGGGVLVSIREQSPARVGAERELLLCAETRDGQHASQRLLALPVLESTLGQLLLELALEILWLRNARRGSAP